MLGCNVRLKMSYPYSGSTLGASVTGLKFDAYCIQVRRLACLGSTVRKSWFIVCVHPSHVRRLIGRVEWWSLHVRRSGFALLNLNVIFIVFVFDVLKSHVRSF
jgi:hypothetical protein